MKTSLVRAIATCVALMALAPQACAATTGSTLRAVVIVSRHGVRSPLDAQLVAPYAAQPWPDFGVPPGYLTPHGFQLMKLFGAYYRAFYASQGLFPATGCPAAGFVYFWADVDERTRQTGRALADGIGPNCNIAVHALSGRSDPLFYPLPAMKHVDETTAQDALRGSIGDDPQGLLSAYALPLARLEEVLGCAQGACPAIASVPVTIENGRPGALPNAGGATSIATKAVDDLELEYTDGLPDAQTGWGRLDAQTLQELLPLFHLSFVLDRGEPYAARSEGSNILSHVLATIDQVATGKRQLQTRAPLQSRFVGFIGHDTTIFEIGTILRMSWILRGYAPDDLPPGGALAFEVRVPQGGGEPFVDVFFMTQTLDQMRNATVLTLASPPERVPVFVPGCPSFDCPLSVFDGVVSSAIDRRFTFQW